MVTPPSQTQVVATIVRQTMEEQGLSVKSLSEKTHIPRTTLARRLAGGSPFTLNELDAIAAQLGQTASDLMAAADAARAA